MYVGASGGKDNSATATYATVAGGVNNKVTNQHGFAAGSRNEVSGLLASAIGYHGKADKQGQFVHAASIFSANGDAQYSRFVMRNATTDATPTEVYLDGASLQLTIAADTCYMFTIRVSAIEDSSGTDAAGYHIQGCLVNNGGTTALVGTPTVTSHESDAAWDCAASADDTNDALAITVTGAAATNVRWVATVELTQVTYP